MFERTVVAGTLATVCLSVSILLAQQEEQQPRRAQGRGGSGGFFGGPEGSRSSSAALLGMTEVQTELAISGEQKGMIDDVQNDLRQQLFGGTTPQDLRNLSDEERRKRFEEFRKKSEEVSKKGDEMISMILDPKQLDRLNQLRLQREGPAAIGRAEVADKLGLSEQQRSKVRKILDDVEAANQGLFRNMRDMSREDRQQAFTKAREQREKAGADILGVLTDKQKEAWDKMLGKKFEFPQRSFGSSGRRGGRSEPAQATAKKSKD